MAHALSLDKYRLFVISSLASGYPRKRVLLFVLCWSRCLDPSSLHFDADSNSKACLLSKYLATNDCASS
jgi:hypothetical protein